MKKKKPAPITTKEKEKIKSLKETKKKQHFKLHLILYLAELMRLVIKEENGNTIIKYKA